MENIDFLCSSPKNEELKCDMFIEFKDIPIENEWLNIKTEELKTSTDEHFPTVFKGENQENQSNNLTILCSQQLDSLTDINCNDWSWFSCYLCSYRVHKKRWLVVHFQEYHSNQHFICYFCERKFYSKTNLRRHVLIHTQEKTLSCKMCSYTTRQQSSLNFHNLKKHVVSKPFTCSLCDYRSSHWKDLKQHKYTHGGEKKFVCNVCGYKTNRRCRLVDHIKSHIVKDILRCSLCGYNANGVQQLDAHTQNHVKKSCNLCAYNATLKGALSYRMVQHACE